MIYLDNAASARIFPQVLEQMNQVWKEWANPNAMYKSAKNNLSHLESLRAEFRKIYNISTEYKIIFVSSVSEANSIVLFNNTNRQILCTTFEHSSIKNFPQVHAINFDNLESFLNIPSLVSISLIQHEAGLILDYKLLQDILKKYDVRLHIDASQAKKIDCNKLNVDYITISSHKIGGPVGIAALVTKHSLNPIIFGGNQEHGMRAGTQAIPLIAGFIAAAKINQENLFFEKHFYNLKTILKQNLRFNCLLENFDQLNSVAYNNFVMPSFYASFCDYIICLVSSSSSSEIVAFMDLQDIAISNSSACKSGNNGIAVLGKINDLGVRISFGWSTTESDVDIFSRYYNQFNQYV